MSSQVNKDVEFSDHVTLLNTDLPYLLDRPITDVTFAPDQPSVLLTVHGPIKEGGGEQEDDDGGTDRTLLCLWNVGQPSAPSKILAANGDVTHTNFSPQKATVAFAGLEDGTLCAWDLRESLSHHQEVVRTEDEGDVFRSPTFATHSAEEGHSSAITALRPLPEAKEEGITATRLESTGGFPTFQLVSIEERGHLIVWTVLDGQRDADAHIGLAHWGSVRVVRTLSLDLAAYMGAAAGVDTNALDVAFDPYDGSRVYVGTEGGSVVHASVQSADHRPNPRSYKPDLDALSAAVRSLAFCPFGEGYMLAGSDDGTVRLHATTNERPLITWPGTVDGQPITKLIWSTSRPCVFVVLDTASRVHLWDLGSGKSYKEQANS